MGGGDQGQWLPARQIRPPPFQTSKMLQARTIALKASSCSKEAPAICNVAENTTRLALLQMYTIQIIKCQTHFHSMVIKQINPKHKSLGCS